MSNDLESVVEDSLNDVMLDNEPTEVAEDTATEVTETEAPVETASTESTETEVTAPGAAEATPKAQDDFEKRFGVPALGVTGRENRIPQPRVKAMVLKAEKDAIERTKKEIESTFTPRITEYETKVKDYEGRLTKVGEFESIMEKDPKTFLGMLSQLPAYKSFFEFVEQASKQPAAAAGTPVETEKAIDPLNDPMPKPDTPDGAGGMVYSMEGVKALLDWNGRQVEGRVTKHFENQLTQRFAPLDQERQRQEQLAQIVPQIEKQITEARTWPNFTELEKDITARLQANPRLSLEGAYMQAYQTTVVPKLTADRNKVRTDVLAEIKKQPAATSAPTGNVKPRVATTAPQSMEDVIKASMEEAGISGR